MDWLNLQGFSYSLAFKVLYTVIWFRLVQISWINERSLFFEFLFQHLYCTYLKLNNLKKLSQLQNQMNILLRFWILFKQIFAFILENETIHTYKFKAKCFKVIKWIENPKMDFISITTRKYNLFVLCCQYRNQNKYQND